LAQAVSVYRVWSYAQVVRSCFWVSMGRRWTAQEYDQSSGPSEQSDAVIELGKGKRKEEAPNPATRRRDDWGAKVDAASNVGFVIAAVESLNADELKSFGRILWKRLAERAVAGVPVIEYGRLRALCDQSPWLTVIPEERREWSVTIVDRVPTYVDVYSLCDVYPEELWASVTAYFEKLQGDDAVLPGGRYSCAQALRRRNLDFLVGLSLGRICQVIQLALTQRKILGYLSGAIVAYSRSQSMAKDLCASAQAPCVAAVAALLGGTDPATAAAGNGFASALPLASWEQVRDLLAKLLHGDPVGSAGLPLSNVKRLFRDRFQIELSETFLGHSKLCELLQDSRFSDICSVRLRGNGYLVFPQQRSILSSHAMPFQANGVIADHDNSWEVVEGNPMTFARKSQFFEVAASLVAPVVVAQSRSDLFSAPLLHDDYVGNVRNTFIHTGPSPQQSQRRQRSV